MDYKVIYSPNAISDLAEIVRFVAQDDPQAALRLGKQLADDADSLARLPYRFPKFRRRVNVRKLVEDSRLNGLAIGRFTPSTGLPVTALRSQR